MTAPARHAALKIFHSNRYCYAMIVSAGNVVSSASTLEASLGEGLASKSDRVASGVVGRMVAKRAIDKGVSAVQWTRRGKQRYHGKIAALLEAAKAEGLALR